MFLAPLLCRSVARPAARVPVGLSNLPGMLRWQTCLADFVEQSAIADFQHLGRLAPVPVIGLQDAKDHVVLHLPNRLLRDAL